MRFTRALLLLLAFFTLLVLVGCPPKIDIRCTEQGPPSYAMVPNPNNPGKLSPACGSFSWLVRWSLTGDDVGEDTDGWLIQRVTVIQRLLTCPGESGESKKLPESYQEWYEAWEVKDGKVLDPLDSRVMSPLMLRHGGERLVHGDTQLFLGRKLPSHFKRDNPAFKMLNLKIKMLASVEVPVYWGDYDARNQHRVSMRDFYCCPNLRQLGTHEVKGCGH